jgi:hypothetical protein
METEEVTPVELLEFFEGIDVHFEEDELLYFDGRCTTPDVDDFDNWVFTLVNINRTCHVFVPPKLAFYFINLELNNVSLLPNSLGTEYITSSRMKLLCRRYKLQHLTALYPYTPGQYYNNNLG